MSEDLLLNPKTKQSLEEFSRQPAPAILIIGPPGSGKTAVARTLAANLLGVETVKLSGYPYFIHLKKPDDKQEISIDAVRAVIKEMRLKPVIKSTGQAKRSVLIEDAGSLSEEAQNALLKIIEEPDADTVFVLTAESEASILPTVVSRTRRMGVGPVNSAEAMSFFGQFYPTDAIESAWQLSQGSVGLLSALLADNDEHPLKQAVEEAKKFLREDKYHRVLYLDSLSSDKPRLNEFLAALSRVLAALHTSTVESGSQSQQKKVSAARRQVNDAIESLGRNVSPRLIGLSLALNLPI